MNTIPKNRTVVLLLALAAVSCGEPEQKLRIRVTDESGTPLKDVACTGGWWKDVFVHGTTGADGMVELTGRTGRHETLAKAKISGYYPSEIYGFMMTGMSGNHWEPWPVEVNLVMKKIRNPHPMYAVRPGDGMRFDFPKGDSTSYGFDLMERDWIAPNGKGKIVDFILEARKGDFKPHNDLPPGEIYLSFPNPNDGIIPMEKAPLGGSELLSPQEAPVDGYLKEFSFSSDPLHDGIFPTVELGRRVWIFRIRTKVDEKGKVISGFYGKIQTHPNVLLFPRGPAFRMTYYLNGQENERNLEWDMKTNLFKDLKQEHWPRKP